VKVRLNHTWNCDATLVDVLTPGVAPPEKYVTAKSTVAFAKGRFKETHLVFETAQGVRAVIPDTEGNLWLWSKA